METFKASVQYNDLEGSIAADVADDVDPQKWLVQNGHMTEDEVLIGIKMWAGENHGTHDDPVSVHFLVTSLDGHQNIPEKFQATGQPFQVRDVRVDMNISDFLALFKRVEFTLSSLDIEGASYTCV